MIRPGSDLERHLQDRRTMFTERHQQLLEKRSQLDAQMRECEEEIGVAWRGVLEINDAIGAEG